MKKVALSLILLLLFIVVIVPQLTKSNKSITGKIIELSAGGVNDLVITLDHNETTYYINRGLQHGFTLNKARQTFIGQKATLFYTDSWTLLAPLGTNSKNITRCLINDSVIYSE